MAMTQAFQWVKESAGGRSPVLVAYPLTFDWSWLHWYFMRFCPEGSPFGHSRGFDIKTGEVRRFLTGPNGCEITGVINTPDGRTMFVNIQHPGETSSERNDPAKPKAVSSWPDGASGGRPRSATIVIRKNDGGVIGT